MKSRRSWLMGLALGAALFFGTPSAKAQFYNSGVPGAFTYQGLLADNGQPLVGVQNVTFTVSLSDSKQNTLWTETLQDQPVTNGIFNLLLGAPASPFVTQSDSLTFNEQYFMTVVATTSNGSVTLGPTPLEAAPYALNAGTVNGIQASTTPVAGELFPVPLGSGYTGTAKVDPAFLPTIPNNLLQNADITTINGLGPNSNGNFQINAGTGIAIVPGTNGITINSTSSSGVSSVVGGPGINASPITGNVVVGIAPGAITGSMLGPGAVTGQKISGIAGMGLVQDGAGLLDVNVDNITIGITSLANGNLLEVLPGGIGTLQLANGSVTNAKIANPWIAFTSTGGTMLPSTASPAPATQLGQTENYDINLGHSNDWTVVQAFHGVNDTGAVANIGAFNETGASTIIGAVTQTGGNVGLAGTAGNTLTIGLAGGANATTINGSLTQSGGATSINNSSNFATTINTGTSTGNVTIGNNTVGQSNAVAINSGSLGTISELGPIFINTTTPAGWAAGLNTTSIGNTSSALNLSGSTNTVIGNTNINTVAGQGNTSVGNTSNTYTLNASTASVNTATTWGGTIGTTYTLTAGTSTSVTAPSNTIAATTGANAITGTTNVNASVNSSTNINTGTSSGTVSIGNAASTTNILGNTNINTSGSATTTVGAAGSPLIVNGTTTHNGPTILNNNITQNAGFTATFDNTQINGNLTATGTLTSQTAGDAFSGNNVNTPTLTLSNSATNGNALSVGSGISTFGTLSVDGNKLVINGLVTTPPVPANDYELVVNGDAQITGTLGVVNLTTSTITATTSVSSPLGNFDNLSTYTAGNNTITDLKGFQVNGLLTVSSNGISSLTGTVPINGSASIVNNLSVGGNETVGGTLGVTGATNLSTLTTSGTITDNSNNFVLGTPGGAVGDMTVNQASHVGSPYTYTFPDSSGTVALLQNIAAIGQGSLYGQTLYWTGTTDLPNNSWKATNLINQNPTTNTVTLLPGATLNASQNTSSAFGGTTTMEGTLVTITTTSVNLGSGTLTSTDPFFEGNSQGNNGLNGADAGQTWWTVYGHVTPWLTPPFSPAPTAFNVSNQPILPSITPFGSLADFEQVIQGDLEVTGTIYNAAIYASLAAAQQIRFDNAEPFTLSPAANTMTFNGVATTAGTPVITVTNIPAGSFGEQVNGSATGAGGIQVTGAGAGTGVVIDPFPIGLDISATTTGIVVGGTGNIGVPPTAVSSPATGAAIVASATGETLDMTTANTGTGLAIGGNTTPATGETINAGTTGLNVTAPTSLNATGTANVNVSNTTAGQNGTNINTGTSNGTVAIGNSASTTNMLGLTNVNTGTSATNTNIGNSASTTTVNGPTNINITGTALTTVGASTDQIWEQINGVVTVATTPIVTPGISNSQYDLTVIGDERITGNLNAGAIWTGLLAAPKIRFDNAQPYTLGGTMLFDGSAPQGAAAGTPVVTISNIPTNSYGLQVNGASAATTGGGIQVTGNGFGTGINVDPFPTGIAINNATTVGLNVTGSATSINATGTINSTGTSGTGSSFTSALAAGTATLTVHNVASGASPANIANSALAVDGAFTSNGNSTVGTNAGTTNTFGNGGGATTNNIGDGGGTTINNIGNNANTNNIGTSAGTNQIGLDASVNWFGQGATTNEFGVSATSNTFGTAGTSTNAINGTTNINVANASNNNTSINTSSGSGTVAIGNAASTITVLGATSVNATGSDATNIGTGTGTNSLGNTTGSTTILGNPLNENAGVGLVTNIGTGAGTGGSINIGNTTSTTTITGTFDANGQTTITSNSSPIFTVQTAGGAVATGIQVQLNGGTLTTGENITASTTDLSLNGAATSVSATGTINTTGTTGTGSTFAGNSAGTATLTVNNTNGTNAPALAVGEAFTSAGNSTVGTNAGTANTFGNNSAASNIIGSSATSNQIGTNATTNFLGLNAGTNNIGGSSAAGTVNNNIGLATGGSTAINTIGTAPAGSTATNVIGSTTGTVSNSMLATGTNTITGTTNINTTGSANTTVGNPANTPGQLAAFNGTVTMTGTGQSTDELTISSVTGGQWGERITDNPASGVAEGLTVNSTATGATSSNAGNFSATGGATGTTNTAVTETVTGSSTGSTVLGLAGVGNVGQVTSASGSPSSNYGSIIRASGSNSVGLDVLGLATGLSPITGIQVDGSSTAITGVSVTNVANIGANVNFTPGLGGSVWGYNANMAGNLATGTYSGYHVQNLGSNNTVGFFVENMSAGNGVEVNNISGGVGIQVGTANSSAVGIISDVHNGGGATALKLLADGTLNTTALQVGSSGTAEGGNVVSQGNSADGLTAAQNGWVETVALTATQQAATHFTILNSLVLPNSSILITVNGSTATTNGLVTVSNVATGSFQVNTTAATFGSTADIYYMVVNH